MKTIGAIGGLGPQATMEFERRLHLAAQASVPQSMNSGYPPLVVYYCRFAPFVADEAGAPVQPIQPHADLLDVARRLGAIADFIVITSNFVHVFQPQIAEAAGVEVLSMIDAVLEEVRRRGWRHVGVLGFREPFVYTEPLRRLGIECETTSGGLRTNLDAAIPRVMEGAEDDADAQAAADAVADLRSRGVDGIILGCTEIPLLLGDAAGAPDLLDPLQLLVDAALARAVGDSVAAPA